MGTTPPPPDTSSSRKRPAASKAPSVKDVARLAGVSVGTVSNVVNGRSTVAPEIRERVEAAVADLGYVPNRTAKALRTGHQPLVGVAALDLTNPFFMEAAVGMERRLADDKSIMVLASTHSNADTEGELLRALAGQGVRGILLSPTDDDLTVAHELVSRGTPIVLFDSNAKAEDMSSIWVDDRSGAFLGASHLIELGHRSLAFFNGPRTMRQGRERRGGVQMAVTSAPHPVDARFIELPAFTAEAGRQGMMELLAATTHDPALRPTALFCANDLLAFGAMSVALEAGLRVPEDLSIVGFDDIALASQLAVPLTTVRQPMDELGWTAADMLLAGKGRVEHQRMFATLVTRASTAPPPDPASARAARD